MASSTAAAESEFWSRSSGSRQTQRLWDTTVWFAFTEAYGIISIRHGEGLNPVSRPCLNAVKERSVAMTADQRPVHS